MKNLRALALAVVFAHWAVAIVHLFIVARMLPSPSGHVSWLAVVLLSCLHLGVCVALLKLSPKHTGLVSLLFFLAAMTADLYEHFLHASANNIFMAPLGRWTSWFDASVYVLLALEILGCSLGIRSISGRMRNEQKGTRRDLNEAAPGASVQKFSPLKECHEMLCRSSV
jgi:hypothetical protein